MDHEDGSPRAPKRWSPWVVFFAACGLLPLLAIATLIGGTALFVNRNASRVDNGGTAEPEHHDDEPDMVFRVRRP